MRVQDLGPMAITFVVAGITLGIGSDILAGVEQGVSSAPASAAVNNTSLGMLELGSWFDTIGLVLAASVIIGVIFYAFGSVGGR